MPMQSSAPMPGVDPHLPRPVTRQVRESARLDGTAGDIVLLVRFCMYIEWDILVFGYFKVGLSVQFHISFGLRENYTNAREWQPPAWPPSLARPA